MSSNFSSNRAYYNSVESRATPTPSGQGIVSEAPTLASKHSKTSKFSSRSSSKNPSTSSSNRSAASPSKTSTKTSTKDSSESSHIHRPKFTLADIRSNSESCDESSQPTRAPFARYAASSIRSEPFYASSTTIATEAEYRVRMLKLLDDIDPGVELNGTSPSSCDALVDPYDAQLNLDEDDYKQDYIARAHGQRS